jgi:hypothetical protein
MSAPTLKGELMFPSKYVAAAELKGKDAIVTIKKVEKAELATTKGPEMKWLLHFSDASKPLVLNKTNSRTIAELHGAKAELWAGKRIILFPTTCQAFGKLTDCIRIRDKAPAAKNGKAHAPDPEPPPPYDGPIEEEGT